ncbi:MAG: glycosyltransferase [Opitutaceae bacterium]|jgi:glycosyltransferase involved in cell wall biosynthesis
MLALSVILPTRNPHPGRLQRTLAGLAGQTLDRAKWEFILVDNASDPPCEVAATAAAALPGFQRLEETKLGLTPARLRGIRAARGESLVFVDDDNVLAPDYLEKAATLFSANPRLAAAGGPVRPEWETSPPLWIREFHGLLALRDLGDKAKICPGGPAVRWPDFAPVGAGLVVRRSGALAYAEELDRDPARRALDRCGPRLGSGGDSDLVFTVLHAGGDVGYFPELQLTHLIPAGRFEAGYLARLNEGIMRSWVVVLRLHDQCPWPAIKPWTVPLRALRARIRDRSWKSQTHHIRWRGHVGQFRGQADIFGLK